MQIQDRIPAPDAGGREHLTLDSPGEVEAFREVLRQQLLGDRELLRDAIAGREDPEIRLRVSDRIALVQRLGEQVGLNEVIERRRGRREEGYVMIPSILLWCIAWVAVATVAVYTAWWVGLGPMPVIYTPVVGYATIRAGRRCGIMAALGASAAYAAMDPLTPMHDLRAAITFVSLAAAIWVTRRYLF